MRVEAFLALDPLMRTLKFRIRDSQEEEAETSSSYIMSSAQKSASKSATMFGLDDIDNILSHRSARKEPSKSLSFQEPRAVTTKAKASSKRKKRVEPEGDSFEVERQLHESLTEAHYEKRMAELEENLAGMGSIAVAKDKALTKLEKDKKGLNEQLLFSEVGLQEAVMVATDEAKVYATRTVL
ncbi:hypothetical protein Hanom_Chr02g00136471 [Helianthus anomalus]